MMCLEINDRTYADFPSIKWLSLAKDSHLLFLQVCSNRPGTTECGACASPVTGAVRA